MMSAHLFHNFGNAALYVLMVGKKVTKKFLIYVHVHRHTLGVLKRSYPRDYDTLNVGDVNSTKKGRGVENVRM
ncbi:hypothetical protein POVCU2_0000620 [Plasmodium ovale curtisi]|uniref:Uncharacterized protein n=1 Tax=Plasmodium ovale curtisi TaxID=864141 RepID=A0A1A8VMB0_PLAOA|nr:hypothetical protein POVCU2_0000620 [Plasmodium ovale curtisi]